MSLARLFVRILTVAALRGRTLAANSVRDSEITPIETRAPDELTPFIAVYVDDSDAAPDGRELLCLPTTAGLVIEIGVSAQMKVSAETDDVEVFIPTTDAGMELTLDLIERQIRVALTDPANPWAELWRKLVLRVGGVKTARGASAEKAVRFAGRQIVISCELLADPPQQALSAVWVDILAALAADPQFAPLAGLVSPMLQGSTVPDWLAVQALLGLTHDEVRGLGVAPAFETADEAAPAASLITVKGDDADRTIEPAPG